MDSPNQLSSEVAGIGFLMKKLMRILQFRIHSTMKYSLQNWCSEKLQGR